MRDRTAAVFATLALGFAGLYWLAVTLSRSGALPFSMEKADFVRQSVPGTIVWLVFSNFGPAIAGVVALAVCRGRGAVAALGRSIVQWRVPARLYVMGWFGLLINAAVVIAGYATHTLRFDPGAFHLVKFVLLFFVMIPLDGPLGEEIGWRGVLLPSLLERRSPLAAAVIVGVIWYAWHVPLYAVDAKMTTAAEHLFFLYTCVALSVIFTWFFLKSNGSTFLAIYLHAASNYSTFFRFKLFPKIADTPVITYAYGGTLLLLAALAAVKLSAARSEFIPREDEGSSATPHCSSHEA
ncbi:MAG TPA: CPBP family intramembrane glutamic endopeptidase [Thermoanaerobaculia bacterium]|nr:CPBP family intramembrane glutamic endopeptidase [Thermoanaerobaculia bacterium]